MWSPRRNRTADPILTMYPRPTAMRPCVFPGRSGPKLLTATRRPATAERDTGSSFPPASRPAASSRCSTWLLIATRWHPWRPEPARRSPTVGSAPAPRPRPRSPAGRCHPQRSRSAAGADPPPPRGCPWTAIRHCSAWPRHTTTVKNDGSPSRRPDTATRSVTRAMPPSVCRSSGWSVRCRRS
jgi:hypothetical protein